MTSRHRVAVTLGCLALVASSCGGDDGGAPTSGEEYLGAWVLTEGTHDGRALPQVDGARITLQLEPGTIGGTASCNSYGGQFRSDGRAFEVGMVSQTEMGCEPEVMASEQAYLAALTDVRTIGIEGGRLRLGGPDVRLLYERLQPVPDAELTGTTWELDTLIDGQAATSAMGAPATLLLRPDGVVVGGTGCRTVSGTWQASGDLIVLTSLAAEGECPPGLAGQDAHVLEVLGDGFGAAVAGDRLTLTSAGNLGLAYRRADTG